MKKLTMWTKDMRTFCRNTKVDGISALRIGVCVISLIALVGCGLKTSKADETANKGGRDESATDSHVDIGELKKTNSDIFAWLYIPDTEIDYPVLQNDHGDDSFYKDHNMLKESDPNGALYIEAANLTNMCDFNEVIHGSSPSDGTMFAGLGKFLDRTYFEERPYIYCYLEGNALIYYTFAAYTRNNNRMLEQYDFTNAHGCQDFLDEIYSSRSMNKIIRSGWENAVTPKNFIITLVTQDPADPSKQIVLVGCLVGDVAGTIDRDIDYSDPGSESGW